jgi:hypothetical protein
LDGAGVGQGQRKCGDGFANVARSFVAGVYDLVVSELHQAGTRTFQLQYLPLEANQETALPNGPDAAVEAELPGPGLVRVHSFALDAPRRVMVRIEARGRGAGFEPCIWVVTEAGERLPDSDRCGPRADRELKLGPGSFFVVVTDKENTSVGAYRLRVLPFDPAFVRDVSTAAQCRTLDAWKTWTSTGSTFPCRRPTRSSSPRSPATGNSGPASAVGRAGETLVRRRRMHRPGRDTTARGTCYATVHADLINATGSYCLTPR